MSLDRKIFWLAALCAWLALWAMFPVTSAVLHCACAAWLWHSVSRYHAAKQREPLGRPSDHSYPRAVS